MKHFAKALCLAAGLALGGAFCLSAAAAVYQTEAYIPVEVRLENAESGGEFRVRLQEGEDVQVCHVPGAVELTFGAAQLIEAGLFDAVIVFGCVIRGGTPHFDYVCQSVTQGVTSLNADCDIPVIFGVLTVDTEQDALDRAGGCLGNKGAEAAEAAIKMVDFKRKVQDL